MNTGMDILAIGAHPDDAEVGCAGTLILAADAGLRVGVADLTAGERSSHGTSEQRREERDLASKIMSLAARLTLNLPDGELGTGRGHRDAVIRLIREVRPAVVLAPYLEDRHPDHAATGKLARDAAFLSGVKKFAEGARPPHRPARLYHYMVHYPIPPTFVVDVSPVWERKLEAISAYQSQFGGATSEERTELDEGKFLRAIEARDTFHGAMIGVEHGEAFYYPGPIPMAFLPGFHDLGVKGSYRIFH